MSSVANGVGHEPEKEVVAEEGCREIRIQCTLSFLIQCGLCSRVFSRVHMITLPTCPRWLKFIERPKYISILTFFLFLYSSFSFFFFFFSFISFCLFSLFFFFFFSCSFFSFFHFFFFFLFFSFHFGSSHFCSNGVLLWKKKRVALAHCRRFSCQSFCSQVRRGAMPRRGWSSLPTPSGWSTVRAVAEASAVIWSVAQFRSLGAHQFAEGGIATMCLISIQTKQRQQRALGSTGWRLLWTHWAKQSPRRLVGCMQL